MRLQETEGWHSRGGDVCEQKVPAKSDMHGDTTTIKEGQNLHPHNGTQSDPFLPSWKVQRVQGIGCGFWMKLNAAFGGSVLLHETSLVLAIVSGNLLLDIRLVLLWFLLRHICFAVGYLAGSAGWLSPYLSSGYRSLESPEILILRRGGPVL